LITRFFFGRTAGAVKSVGVSTVNEIRIHQRQPPHRRSPLVASNKGLCAPQLSHSIRITNIAIGSGVVSAMFYPKGHYYINAYVCIMHIGGSISAPTNPCGDQLGYRFDGYDRLHTTTGAGPSTP